MDAIKAIVEESVGLPLDFLQGMPAETLDNLRHTRRRQRHFDNAIKDFVTVVLNTELIGPEEDRIRIRLIRIVHLLEGAVAYDAVNALDDEFSRKYSSGWLKPLALEVVQLLRRTASATSDTEESRSAWQSYPSDCQGDIGDEFSNIVRMARMELQGERIK